MRRALAQLRRRNRKLETENEALRARIHSLEVDLEETHRKLQHVLTQLFGKKTEAIDPRQLELMLSGVERRAPGATDVFADRGGGTAVRRSRAARKPRIPENLPTEEIVIDPDEVSAQPQAYQCIGEEVTQELDVVPPKYFRRRVIRRSKRGLLRGQKGRSHEKDHDGKADVLHHKVPPWQTV